MSAAQPTEAALLAAARRLLAEAMCLRRGEHLLITADTGTDQAAVQAVAEAGHALGAKVATLTLTPPLPFQGSLADPFMPEPLLAAAPASDVWVDLCMPYLGGSTLYDRVTKNGRTRYLLGADMGAGGLARMFGAADLDRVFTMSEAFGRVLSDAAGAACRITTPLGTDVRFELANPEGLAIERAQRPGGYFVPGTVVIVPALESVRGTIVCETAFHEYYTALPTPYRFEVDGRIASLEGGGDQLEPMQRALERAGNGRYGYIVHFSCGFHPGARFTGNSFIEDQRIPGADAVGFGLPPWVEGGGENHPDCVMRDQSFWIGDQLVVDRGAIVWPPELATLAGELASAA